MPIRFQVDGDFYDHPKVLGMSDAAFALWTRAGSYSAAKLTDGFVPEDALSLFSTAQQEAAGELVRRGLWRRVKGGFRFHEWDQRNLTRARVDADRQYERERKQRQRHQSSNSEDIQVQGQIVPPGQPPGLPADNHRDSDRSPAGSVSVSVSVSDKEPPPPAATQDRFAEFWTIYPRKVGKREAEKAWRAALKRKADPDVIIAAAAHYRDDPSRKPEYTKHPGPWLNAGRYEDQAEPATPTTTDHSWGWWDN